jgi:UDP-N-acetyl-D-mannosaminuronate dehydrogenase
MPRRIVRQLIGLSGSLEGKDVAILGLAYRGGVKEDAYSGLYELAKHLEQAGATVHVSDPLYSEEELRVRELRPLDKRVRLFAAILHTDHREFSLLSEDDFPSLEILIDGRNFLDPAQWRGVKLISLGRGTDPQ